MWLKRLFNKEPELIKSLKRHHRELFKLYSKINDQVNKENIAKLPELLERFYYRYKQHILYEDNYFYAKLRELYDEDIDKRLFIRTKRREMDSITNVLLNFIENYRSPEVIRENFDEFKSEFYHIGDVLKKRIDFEENELYLLYKD